MLGERVLGDYLTQPTSLMQRQQLQRHTYTHAVWVQGAPCRGVLAAACGCADAHALHNTVYP